MKVRVPIALLLLAAGSVRANPVSVEWKSWDNHLYDSAGVDHRTADWRFEVVLDPAGDTDVSAMLASNVWQIGTEATNTADFGADDDLTFAAQNANWTYRSDWDWGLVDHQSVFEGSTYGGCAFYVRFFNAGTTGAATEAGLIYNRAGNWRLVPDADPALQNQETADVGRVGTESGELGGSVDSVHDDGWATMAGPVPPTRVLTIVSDQGGADPREGEHEVAQGADILCRQTNSPLFAGTQATQYVCIGWSATGGAFGNGELSASLRITGDVALVWRWQTNYWLDADADAWGSVAASGGWYAAGSTAWVEAAAAPYYDFLGWTGSLNSAESRLAVVMKHPHLLRARFAPHLVTNGTPLMWLAQYGLTNRPGDTEAEDDQDKDGMRTWKEYIADTDPTNEHSVLSLRACEARGDAGLALRWPASTARWYRVTAAPQLASGSWTNVSGTMDGRAGVGYLEWVDLVGSEGPRYYRVEALMFP